MLLKSLLPWVDQLFVFGPRVMTDPMTLNCHWIYRRDLAFLVEHEAFCRNTEPYDLEKGPAMSYDIFYLDRMIDLLWCFTENRIMIMGHQVPMHY